jgi:hypothetical protein
MVRTIRPGEVGLILVPFIADDVADENNLDGIEASIDFAVDKDDIVRQTLLTRVVATGIMDLAAAHENANRSTDPSSFEEELRERSLDATEAAVAVLRADPEVLLLLGPWLAKKRPGKTTPASNADAEEQS